jgi:acetyl-CoA acetyltransferase
MVDWQAEVTRPLPKWKDKFAIVGIGETKYSRRSGVSQTALSLEACKKAVDDAGLSARDIDCLIEGWAGMGASSEEFQTAFGGNQLNYYSRGLGGGSACLQGVQTAMSALSSGLCDYAMVAVANNGSSEFRASNLAANASVPMMMQGGDLPYIMNNWFSVFGMEGTSLWYSHVCRRYMHDYGLKHRHMAALASTFRSHALLNDNAMMKEPLSIEDYLNSPILVDPFHRWNYSLQSDGGGAFIVTTADRAKNLKQPPVYIMGIGIAHPTTPNNIYTRKEVWWGHKWAAPMAYKMAGVTPGDIDFAEIYDGYIFVALIQIAPLGFATPEDAGPFCEPEENNIQLGGKIPFNTHGGLCSQAHILGINHVCEAVKQLRGQAGAAQVKHNGRLAEIGIVTGAGDLGDGSVLILRR